jgi:RNA polymerase sigma-70 factor (ECF subfamily)
MGEQQYNIRQVHAHSNVHNVKTARKFKDNHTEQEKPSGDPAGSEPLDTSVFTAGFTFQSRPGYLFANHRSPNCPAIAGLIRHAQTADKPPRAVRCRSPPPPFRFSHFKNRNGGFPMKTINLRDYYPFYTSDCFIDVPDEVAAMLRGFELQEAAYRLRTYRHRAYYSLDRDDGIEHDILFVSLSPCEIYERKVTMEQLHAAIASLPDKQAKRIYAHYFLGMGKSAIAKTEGISKAAVGASIERGLRHMEVFLKKYF